MAQHSMAHQQKSQLPPPASPCSRHLLLLQRRFRRRAAGGKRGAEGRLDDVPVAGSIDLCTPVGGLQGKSHFKNHWGIKMGFPL